MKLGDFVNSTIIDARKFTHYALNPNSPRGKNKAIVFEKVLGFTKNNYTELLLQIESKALHADAAFHSEDKYRRN